VSQHHRAYASTNIASPPAPLAAAAQAGLDEVERLAQLCPSAPAATTPAAGSGPGTSAHAAGPSDSANATGTSTAPSAVTGPPSIRATVISLRGDVEFSTGQGQPFVALTPGTVLKEGYFVSTGYDSMVSLDFAYATLTVGQMSELRLDSFTNAANIARTQVYLRVGSVSAKVKHVDAIRSDFHVASPGADASIRGSEMIVSVAKATGATAVYTVEDASYVQGSGDASAVTVAQGYMSAVGVDHRASPPAKYSAAELPNLRAEPAVPTPRPGSAWLLIGGSAAALGLAVVLVTLLLLRRASRAS
jgi:hypothetical protein